jgi:hypothetical protein
LASSPSAFSRSELRCMTRGAAMSHERKLGRQQARPATRRRSRRARARRADAPCSSEPRRGTRELRKVNGSLSRVARLIHLNGPPGIGKSTVASAFADRHPGVLNLDIDQATALVGGKDRFSESFAAGVLLATAMARVHLASGHDVILPQMMTDVNAEELAVFEASAAVAKAEYCQILLIANVESAVDRCMARSRAGDPRQDAVSKVIEDNGGPDFIRKLHAQVIEFSACRQPYAVIDCERLTVEQTCQAVEAALAT